MLLLVNIVGWTTIVVGLLWGATYPLEYWMKWMRSDSCPTGRVTYRRKWAASFDRWRMRKDTFLHSRSTIVSCKTCSHIHWHIVTKEPSK